MPHTISERLDHFLEYKEWQYVVQSWHISHSFASYSDHVPIILSVWDVSHAPNCNLFSFGSSAKLLAILGEEAVLDGPVELPMSKLLYEQE